VEGSAALALVASGVVFGGPFMIAALPSGFAPSPEDAASAVATLGFFFVMLQELKNTKCIYIHMPLVYGPEYFHRELHRGRQLPLSMPGT
jgi:hypothetical protein